MFRCFSKDFVLAFVIFGMISVDVTDGLTGKEAVKRFFEYFRSDNPLGIPVANFEEPMEIYSPLEIVPVKVINGKLSGHSKIKFEQIFVDFLWLTGSAKISASRLEFFGNYSWPGFYFTSEGFMNATFWNISGYSNFTMFIDENNLLQVTDIQIKQESEDVFINFTNLIWEHELIISSGAVEVFFDEIVLEIFRQLRPFLISEVNKNVAKFISTLPPAESFMTPEDAKEVSSSGESHSKTLAILLRRLIYYLGMDPLYLPDEKKKIMGINFKVSNIVLFGISTVSDIDSLLVVYQDKQIFLESSMTYSKLLLFYNIESGGLDLYAKNQLNDVDLKIKLIVDPSLKIPPQIKYIGISVGSFGKLRSKKSLWGKIINFLAKFDDVILKGVVNALQGPLRKFLQNKINNIDIEESLLNLLDKKD